MTLKVENGMIRCYGYMTTIGDNPLPEIFDTPSQARARGYALCDMAGISRAGVDVSYYDETFSPDDLEYYIDTEDIVL